MKQDLTLTLVVLYGVTTLFLLVPRVSTAQIPVPYFAQGHRIGPLSWNEMAYLRRLVQLENEDLEMTTNSAEAEGSDAWDNSCVSEPVNGGGFSKEQEDDEVKESDETIPQEV
uniref:Uncharacterized protein n=1 Tax=Anopheles culicifacies TaxID=139723 RepID=A0A182MLH9_9DIPT